MEHILSRSRVRVILAEDHAMVRSGLEKLLEKDYDLVGIASDGRELIEAVLEHKPDVAIVDVGLPLVNGIEAVREIRKERVSTRIVFISIHTDTDYVVEALQAGGTAYVPKQAPPEELHLAIRDAMFGRVYVSPMIRGEIFDLLRRGEERVEILTGRQRQVMQLVAEGYSSRQIGEILKVAAKTVEFHRANIMGRLGIRTSAQLIRYALQAGILPADPAPPLRRDDGSA